MDLNKRIFNNPLILEEILSHSLSDITESSNLRLVNKEFNNTILVILRKKFRDIDIRIKGKTAETIRFFFNGQKLIFSKVPLFFEFLNKTVNLEVECLRLKDYGFLKFRKRMSRKFHYYIHFKLIVNNQSNIKIFTGFEVSCDGCYHCFRIAKTAKEYGPISMKTLKRLKKLKKKNSRQLIITTELVNQIASDCVGNAKSKEQCFKKLNSIIKNNRSRDTLTLWICETQFKKNDPDTKDHFHIPLEVLEMFIQKWSIKRLRIEPKYGLSYEIHDDEWMHSGYFTPFRFNDLDLTELSPIKLDQVDVDLSYSFYCRRDFAYINSSIRGHRGYVNNLPSRVNHRGFSSLIVNIQKLFSPNSISFKNFLQSPSHLWEIYEALCNTLIIFGKSAKLQKHRPILTLDFKFFIQVTDVSKLSADNEEESYFDIPELFYKPAESFSQNHYTFLSPVYSSKDALMIEWIGKQFKIEDHGIVFNWNVLLNKSAIDQTTTSRKIKEFLNFFM